MQKTVNKILVIDDQESFHKTIKLTLDDNSYQILSALSGEDGIEIFSKEQPDLVITDLILPNLGGIEVLKRIKAIDPRVPIVMLSAYDNVPNIIEAMMLGAYDFLTKPININALRILVANIIQMKSTTINSDFSLPKHDDNLFVQGILIGKTAVMRELIKTVGVVSTNRINILIEGENGTGKEIIARTIHSSGISKSLPFIGVNCTALSSTILESELFGHEKGAFTGAVKNHKGKFELAGEGTLFLDEISEMPMDMQVKLLRVLQEKEFERVGGEENIPFKARVIAATNQNLHSFVLQKKFRLDLYHRLKVMYIRVPALRERKEDIAALTISLLGRINKELNKSVTKIPYETMEVLKERNWTGNVRELENTLRRSVIFAKDDTLRVENIKFLDDEDDKATPSRIESLAAMEYKHIEYVLSQVNWNKQKACKILDITKPTLLKKIRKYNIQKKNSN